MQPLFDPADFRLPPGIVHVCAGGETAALRAHDAALLRYVADKSSGLPGRSAQEAEIEAAARFQAVEQPTQPRLAERAARAEDEYVRKVHTLRLGQTCRRTFERVRRLSTFASGHSTGMLGWRN